MGKRKQDDSAAAGDADAKKRQRTSEDPFAKKAKKPSKPSKYTGKKNKDKYNKHKLKKAKPEPEVDEDVVDLAMTDMDSGKVEQEKKEPADGEVEVADEKPAKEKKKKTKKDKKAAKKAEDETTTATEEGAEKNGDEEAGDDEAEAAGDDQAGGEEKKAKKNRFIVFVGNLPYSATAEDVERHFTAVQPASIRLIHEKANPTKSRGIAFLEFAGYDRMKTCLKTMHHTTLKCQGRDFRGRPKLEERQINVELTAGGGGSKSEGRREKIKAKNEKLNDERQRRAVEEEKQKIKKEQERLAKEGEKRGGDDGIHPSRRAYVPGARR
ncbi:hypothetical protein BJ166DRAFT_540732 [Pestalotiopsis sp. NC0098]|nr:hypothetical protein BJ166DRAFT_540732 [Pestalotiopsis sp. NC0098]